MMHRMGKKKLGNRKGFTMAEVLIVVAILGVLSVVSIVSVVRYQKTLKQKSLDDQAETIYMAVQNQITRLKLAGNSDKYRAVIKGGTAADVKPLSYTPSDWNEDASIIPNVWFITSAARDAGGAADYLMSSKSVDDNLLLQNWIIEYDPDNSSVYAVFYSEKETFDESSENSDLDALRTKSARVSAGSTVGYYGGSITQGSEAAEGVATISVNNKETLDVTFQYALNTTTTGTVTFDISIKDQHGHERKIQASTRSAGEYLVRNFGRRYYLTLTLDDLSHDSTRFFNKYGAGNTSLPNEEVLCAGDNLTISMEVTSVGDANFEKTSRQYAYPVSSLYADDSQYSTGSYGPNTNPDYVSEAHIAYVRHLQNLDASYIEDALGAATYTTAGKYLPVHAAAQTNDISFNDKTLDDEDFYNIYQARNEYFYKVNSNICFKPIKNDSLKSYMGAYDLGEGEISHSIIGMHAATIGSAPAGLFSVTASGMTIDKVWLLGERVTSVSGDVGGLAGKVSGNLDIKDCKMYLSAANGDLRDKDQTYVWLEGASAGGLIGSVTSGTVKITDSFSSTVLKSTVGDGAAGGLIGKMTGGIAEISKSYSDSYIYGYNTGGLIGESRGTANLSSVYAAGFQYGYSMAGFANGSLNNVSKSYAASKMIEPERTSNFTAHSIAHAIQGSGTNVLYYYSGSQYATDPGLYDGGFHNIPDKTSSVGSMTHEEILAALGSDFETDPGDTVPYNLIKGMALSTYPYPRLKNMVHYGDWEADFIPGAVVYWETHTNDKSFFYGGNQDTLYNNLESGAVKADGYGIIYRESDDRPDSVKVTYHYAAGDVVETINLTSAEKLTVSDGGINYYIYKFSRENVNPVITADNAFYTKVSLEYIRAGHDNTGQTYYFNPHFARAVGYMQNPAAPVPELNAGEAGVIYIRSARHLYNLSLYYNYYSEATRDRLFQQTYEISYRDYDWAGAFNSAVASNYNIVRQNPIGNAAVPFKAVYDGGSYRIRNISFVLEDGKNGDGSDFYSGMFARNAGTIRNVVLYADYDEKVGSISSSMSSVNGQNHYYLGKDQTAKLRCYVGTDETIGANQAIYMGILLGQNDATGIVMNCAVAGYYMADASGTIVGYANSFVYAGGLAGENRGTITSTAADVPCIRLTTNYSTADVGGFVGINRGIIRDAYALGHIEAINPRGGSIELAGFASKNNGAIISAYSAVNIQTSGNSTAYAFAPDGGSVTNCKYLYEGIYKYAGKIYSFNNKDGAGTKTSYDDLIDNAGIMTASKEHTFEYDDSDEAYIYRAVVTDVRENATTYVHYGTWQRKVELGNFGLFYWEKEKDSDNSGYKVTYIGINKDGAAKGTTLCKAYDDDGIVDTYGYGYYEKDGSDVTSTPDAALKVPAKAKAVAAAAAAFKTDMPEYTFYPFETLPMGESVSADYLYLDQNVHNADWQISGQEGENTISMTFTVSPFFGNALSCKSIVVNGGDAAALDFTLAGEDGQIKDMSQTPGSATNQYEVRNVAQLQYINWNAGTKTVNEMVTASNYRNFTYLPYTSVGNRTGRETAASAGNNAVINNWKQSHDINGTGISGFAPIAGAGTSSGRTGDYNATMYVWFGGSYDGGSYKIEDLSISSRAYTVGVFGSTVAADINNVILYSEHNATIERNTDGYGTMVGAYSLGSLIGTAYDYDGAVGNHAISNCAVAGYKVVDNSTSIQGLGETCVGGLLGVANVNLNRCTSVSDIEINCTHSNGVAQWGVYVRVGGITGATQGTLTDCYSGGKVSVGTATLTESYSLSYATQGIYIGGIAGSGFTSNYWNFTNNGLIKDGCPKAENCYTYMKFPAKSGHIKEMFLIASLSDREGQRNSGTMPAPRAAVVKNCYYLDSIINTTGLNRTYGTTLNSASGGANVAANPTDPYSDLNLRARTYEDLSDSSMSASLGASFGFVTTTQGANNADISGKYSFPGNNRALDGLNYPFPTVVVQPDIVYGGNVNVHYGEWPLAKAYWEYARDTMEIFAEKDPAADFAYKTEVLMRVPSERNLTVSDFNLSVGGIVEISEVTLKGTNADDNACKDWNVKLKALKPGTEIISVVIDDVSTSLTLQVDANFNITTDPASLVMAKNTTKQLNLYAKADAKDYSTRAAWTVVPEDNDYATASTVTAGTNRSVITSTESGRIQLIVNASLTYNGNTYTSSKHVSLYTYGVIGLSNNGMESGTVFWNETSRAETDGTGAVKDYPAGSDRPELSLDKNSNFFLYESVADGALGTDRIIKAKVNGTTVNISDGATSTYNVGNFVLDIGPAVSTVSDNKFQYRRLGIFPKDGETGGNIDIKIVLQDGETMALYTLFGTVTSTHSLSYDVNGGNEESISTKVVHADNTGKVTVTGETPSRPGYTFDGWNTEASGSGTDYAVGDEVTVSSEMTLFAKWSPITYKIKYDLVGSSSNPDTLITINKYPDATSIQEFTYGDTSQALPTDAAIKAEYPEIDDWKGNNIAGWNTAADGSGTTYMPGQSAPNASTVQDAMITLYPVWASEVTYHWKVLDVDGGTVISQGDETVPYDSQNYSVTLPASASRAYYKFAGTFKSDRTISGNTSFAAGATVTVPGGNITFVAEWSDYAIIFHNGANTTRVEIPYGTSAGEAGIPTPARGSDYDFVGWYTAANGGGTKLIDASGSLLAAESGYSAGSGPYTFALTSDQDLYARWKKKSTIYVPVSGPAVNTESLMTLTSNGNIYAVTHNGTSVGVSGLTVSSASGYYKLNGDPVTGSYIASGVNAGTMLWKYDGTNIRDTVNNYYLGASSSGIIFTSYSPTLAANPSYRFVLNNNNNLRFTASRRTYYLRLNGTTLTVDTTTTNNTVRFYEPLDVYQYTD